MVASLISATSPLGIREFRWTGDYRAWEEPRAKEPAGVCRHDDGRPMLGRKLQGESQRELTLLGLTVSDNDEIRVVPKLAQPSGTEA